MTRIEIITVRLSCPKYESDVRKFFREIRLKQGAKANEVITSVLFRCSEVSSDWSIHLHWETQQTDSEKTLIGRTIAEVLCAFGLVNHSVWEHP